MGKNGSTCFVRPVMAEPVAATAWSCGAVSARRLRFTKIGVRNAPVGYLFDVMTNGFGAMQDYSAQVPCRTGGRLRRISARFS